MDENDEWHSCGSVTGLDYYKEFICPQKYAFKVRISKEMSGTTNLKFAVASFNIMAKCDCSLSSMAVNKMPFNNVDLTPLQQDFTSTVGDNV